MKSSCGNRAVCCCLALTMICAPVLAQLEIEGLTERGRKPAGLKFDDTPVDAVLQIYSDLTGRTILKHPKVPGVKITLRNQTELTLDETLQAIETVLSMHDIAVIKDGEKFLRVVPIGEGLKDGTAIIDGAAERPKVKSSELISEMITLHHIGVKEAEKAIANIKHAYGQVHLFERTNSMLITDTAGNIERLSKIITHIDQPIRRLEEPNVIQIRYAKAGDIKSKLEEIVKEALKDAEQSTVPRQSSSGPPGVEKTTPARGRPTVIRAPRPQPESSGGNIEPELIEQAERGMITGDVKIIADDRTNILIIITRRENMEFFDKIVKVLDVPTDPDVVVKIIRLEYADAENVASTLNTLIGGQGKSKDNETAVPARSVEGEEVRSAALRDYVDKLTAGTAGEKTKSKVGELSSENIKILPDKRTNALIIMASTADLATIEDIVKNMDMMLSQVLVEVTIIQVDLGNDVESGVHWVQRSLTSYEKKSDGSSRAVLSGAGSAGGGSQSMLDASTLTALGSWAQGGGLTAYFTHFGWNMDMILHWTKTDDRTKVLSTPVIVTTDNTKAIISSSQQRYFLKGGTIDQQGNYFPQTELMDFGLELEVTPHINEKGNVMMEIVQKVSEVGASQEVQLEQDFKAEWPTTKKRSFTASISVRDRETIVLGGLVRTDATRIRTKVPILGSIPLLGRLFRYEKEDENRAEVVVFVTPYVLDTPEAIALESARRKEALNVEGFWTRGWSASKLADPADPGVSGGESSESPAGRDRELDERARLLAERERALALRAARLAQIEETEKTAGPLSPAGKEPLDPDLLQFIGEQEEKWGGSMREMDRIIEQEINGHSQENP